MPGDFKKQSLDIRDFISPLSILKVRSIMNEMKEGEILEVWSNDVETKAVLKQIIDNSNDEFLGVEYEDKFEKIYIRRHLIGSRQ